MKGKLIDYCSLEEISDTRDWFTDVGIRYFPFWLLQKIKAQNFVNNVFIPACIQELLFSGADVMGVTFQEDWNHFAVAEDFVASIAS